MNRQIIQAVVLIQTWGDSTQLLQALKINKHVISIFHIMGKHSFLVDVNFDDSRQFQQWIFYIKSLKLDSGVPAVLAIQTGKIIEIFKKKEIFTLKDYSELEYKFHMFLMIDNPHHDEKLIPRLRNFDVIYSILHVQGEHSFISELISDNYNDYREIIEKIKALESVRHIETQEVISIEKYRNQVLTESGELVYPQEDLREIYVL